jgi:hypothetical protein
MAIREKEQQKKRGIVRDERGQDQPKDKDRAQQADATDYGDVRPEDQHTADVGGRGLRGHDKQQSVLRDRDRPAEHDDGNATPEGLRRPRKGPYDKSTGRA